MKGKFISVIVLLFCLLLLVKCDYFGSKEYHALPRAEKEKKLWEKITAEQTPYGWYSAFSLAKIFFEKMSITFDTIGDTFQSDRNKLIHSVGVTGLVDFKANQDQGINPYTGVFKGCDSVVLRMSVAKKPDESKKRPEDAKDNFTPGFGIKFLRDKIPSGNTVAMFGVNGQDSWNFFENDFSNHIKDAEGLALKALALKFSEATDFTNEMGLLDMAKYDQFGKDYGNDTKFPYKLIFKPNPEIKAMFTREFTKSYMDQLTSIPKGKMLYNVCVQRTKDNKEVVCIGKLVLKEKFVKSKFGDKDLFFRHGYFDDDLKVHPDWKSFHKMFLPEDEVERIFGSQEIIPQTEIIPESSETPTESTTAGSDYLKTFLFLFGLMTFFLI